MFDISEFSKHTEMFATEECRRWHQNIQQKTAEKNYKKLASVICYRHPQK
jgi:hypothetical protein